VTHEARVHPHGDRLAGSGKTMKLARRPAVESDRDFVWSAYSRAYREVVTRQFGAWHDGHQKPGFDEKWDRSGFEILEVDGTPAGAVWTTDERTFLQLREIFLVPTWQGKGIGTRVVRQELGKARSAGKPLRLRVLKESRALALYARLGFGICGETETQYWMEAV